LRPRAKPEAAPGLSAVNENDYYLYWCSPHEIGKTVSKKAKLMQKTGEKEKKTTKIRG